MYIVPRDTQYIMYKKSKVAKFVQIVLNFLIACKGL